MAMLEVVCRDCDSKTPLRGWLEKEDLKGTEYEHRMNTVTEDELFVLQESGKVKDPWGRFLDNPMCPVCGSKNVYWFYYKRVHTIFQ